MTEPDEELREATVVPASYADYGKVWLAEVSPPQGDGAKAKEVIWPLPGHTSSIIVEFQDLEKMVMEQFKDTGCLSFDSKEHGIVKYAFHPKDARYLIVHLLDALARGGDPVGIKLQSAFDQVMETVRPNPDEEV